MSESYCNIDQLNGENVIIVTAEESEEFLKKHLGVTLLDTTKMDEEDPSIPDRPNGKAKKLIRKAKKGDINAKMLLADLFRSGTCGMNRSREKAVALWEEVADVDKRLDAMFNLAQHAQINLKDYTEAREWYHKCIEHHSESDRVSLAHHGLDACDRAEKVGLYAPIKEDTITCGNCGTEQTDDFKLKACQCHTAFFCNAKCQKVFWPNHKSACKAARTVNKKRNKKARDQSTLLSGSGSDKQKGGSLTWFCDLCNKESPIDTIEPNRDHVMCCGGSLCHGCGDALVADKKTPFCPLCNKAVPSSPNLQHKAMLKLDKKKRQGWLCHEIGRNYLGIKLVVYGHTDLTNSKRGEGCAYSEENFVKWQLRGAELGYNASQYILGHAYDVGIGVKRSHKGALKWFVVAADNRHALAQHMVAATYYYTTPSILQRDIDWKTYKPPATDLEKVVKYWTLAAEQNYTDAMVRLGVLYGKCSCRVVRMCIVFPFD